MFVLLNSCSENNSLFMANFYWILPISPSYKRMWLGVSFLRNRNGGWCLNWFEFQKTTYGYEGWLLSCSKTLWCYVCILYAACWQISTCIFFQSFRVCHICLIAIWKKISLLVSSFCFYLVIVFKLSLHRSCDTQWVGSQAYGKWNGVRDYNPWHSRIWAGGWGHQLGLHWSSCGSRWVRSLSFKRCINFDGILLFALISFISIIFIILQGKKSSAA